jgi:hypothetical protein
MRRFAFFALLASIPVLSAQSVFACGGNCHFGWWVGPQTGAAPMTVVVQGETPAFNNALRIDMGGEGLLAPDVEPYFNGSPCYGDGFHAQHRFFCPGTYTIQLLDPDDPNAVHTSTITALPPPRYSLFVFDGDNEHEAYIATQISSSQRPFFYSTVDWGDGTSEKFTYALRGLYAGTPNHSYAADGQYTATVKHHYEGQYCSWDQTETIQVKIPNPTTATNPSTWGYVKSMYR